MKARVKATGEIVEITSGVICIDKNGYKQTIHSDFIEPYIDINTDNDYWEKLKHQHIGMAMQGILANPEMMSLDDIDVAATAIRIANITISKLKEESQCEK